MRLRSDSRRPSTPRAEVHTDLHLILAKTRVERYFDPDDASCQSTERGWMRDGTLQGQEIGGCVYVDEDWFKLRTGNELADRIQRVAVEHVEAGLRPSSSVSERWVRTRKVRCA